MLPNFICIGAEKSGTTWLYYNLKKHSQIWMPPVKEIHYLDEIQYKPFFTIFDRFFDNHFYNQNWRQILKKQIKSNLRNPDLKNILWYSKYLFKSRNDKWYASLFEMSNGKISGDITPAYSSFTAERVAYVHKIMPDSKIIFLMRNPIDRAWSDALMYERKKGEKFSEEEFINCFNSKGSRTKGNYLRTIKNWQSFYPQEQFFIGYFEEIEQCPENLLTRLSNFLKVDLPENSLNPKTIRKKINYSKTKKEIPLKFSKHLAGIYYNELESLHANFGSYTSEWFNCAKKILEKDS